VFADVVISTASTNPSSLIKGKSALGQISKNSSNLNTGYISEKENEFGTLEDDVQITAYRDFLPETIEEIVVKSMLVDHHVTRSILNRRGQQFKTVV
jgi:hypothetical protein